MFRFDFRNVFGVSAVLVFLFAGSSAAASYDWCETAEISDVDSTLRVRGDRADNRQCFTTELPSAGWLLLEATVPSTAAAEPRLEFLGRRCDASVDVGQPFRHHTRSAGSSLLEVNEAGNYQFCVAPQDPAQWLDDFRVTNRFAAFGKEHEYEHEPDPDPLVDPFGCGDTRLGHIPFGKEHEYEHEPDPDPFTLDPCDPRLRRVCLGNVVDDHADTLGCASIVGFGRSVAAELGNGWQDDSDLFGFHVDEPATVRIESTGVSDTLGGLYDRYGYRLQTDDDSGAAANFRIVKTLVPGWYFARVEGGGEGTYELKVEALVSEE